MKDIERHYCDGYGGTNLFCFGCLWRRHLSLWGGCGSLGPFYIISRTLSNFFLVLIFRNLSDHFFQNDIFSFMTKFSQCCRYLLTKKLVQVGRSLHRFFSKSSERCSKGSERFGPTPLVNDVLIFTEDPIMGLELIANMISEWIFMIWKTVNSVLVTVNSLANMNAFVTMDMLVHNVNLKTVILTMENAWMVGNAIIQILTTGKTMSIHLYAIALHFTMNNVAKHIFVLMKKTVSMVVFALRKTKDVTARMGFPECNVNLKTNKCVKCRLLYSPSYISLSVLISPPRCSPSWFVISQFPFGVRHFLSLYPFVVQ